MDARGASGLAIDLRKLRLPQRLKPVVFILKAVLTYALMYYLLTRDWSKDALQRLDGIDAVWASAAGLVQIVATILAAARWQWIVRWLTQAQMNVRSFFGWIGVASLIGQFLPSTVGGDAFRIGALATITGVKDSFRTVLTDRAVGMVGLAIVVLPTGAALAIQSRFAQATVWPLLMAAGGIGFAILLVTVFPRLKHPHALLRPFQMLAEDMVAVLRGRSIRVLVISVCIHVLAILVFVCLANALHQDAKLLWPIAIVVPPALLISSLPVSLGGWGIREGAIVAGFALLGQEPGVPLLLSLIYGVLGVAVSLLGTIVWTANPSDGD